jgi:short-subunit dehydrogenase
MDIKNKVIVITGASQGIGEAAAKYLSGQGAKVVLAARSADSIKKLALQLPDSLAVPTDMRKPEDIQNLVNAAVKKYGRIDILINNAGQGMYGPLENIDIEKYKQIMELNVYGVLRAMQAVIPQMRLQGRGQIINISSRVSKNYFPALSAYASTKYALNALSLTARTELEKDNIIVSVFHPKMTASSFGKNSIGTSPWAGNRDSGGSAGSPPSGRPAPEVDTPEQVAEKIAELIVSEEPEAQM